jgi:hypothetical protein
MKLGILFSLICICSGFAQFPEDAPAPAGGPPPDLTVKRIDDNQVAVGEVRMDRNARTITLPAKLNMRDGLLEYALVTHTGKLHESLLATTVAPQQLHVVCLLLGLKELPLPEDKVPAGNRVSIDVSWETDGKIITHPLAALISLTKPNPTHSAAALEPGPWLYNGSTFVKNVFLAQRDGGFISLIHDPAALINNPREDRHNDEVHIPATSKLPPRGTAVTVTIKL